MTIGDVKFNIKSLMHGTKESAINDINMMMERAANTLLTKIDPIETMRTQALTNTVHSDVYNYALPSDFKKPIDLFPQDDRGDLDKAQRWMSEDFDLTKAIEDKIISIESDNASKILRINWGTRQGKVFHTMNSLTDNGTWAVVGSATNLVKDDITKHTGSASIRFDLVTTGDGIQITDATSIDLTDEDEVADAFVWVYLNSSPTSITAKWGNDLTTNYWTSVAQTAQADGTAFKTGWNLIKFPWLTATESGTVAPATIDSFEITFASGSAITQIRIDNIIFSIGRNFDIKYYSKFLFKNSSGTWITRPTADTDEVVLDNDGIQIFLLECLVAASQQMQNRQMTIDTNWAKNELKDLYGKYLEEHPSQTKKVKSVYYKR